MQVELKIKETRENKGISLRKLGELTGIDRHYLSEIENGKISTDKILFIEMLLISENLGVEISELFIVRNIHIE